MKLITFGFPRYIMCVTSAGILMLYSYALPSISCYVATGVTVLLPTPLLAEFGRTTRPGYQSFPPSECLTIVFFRATEILHPTRVSPSSTLYFIPVSRPSEPASLWQTKAVCVELNKQQVFRFPTELDSTPTFCRLRGHAWKYPPIN